MRALTACTVASLLLSFPARGARAQTAAVPTGLGEAPVAVLPTEPGEAAVGAKAGRGTLVPIPMISTVGVDFPTKGSFTVYIRFTEDVTEFSNSDIDVTHGDKSQFTRESAQRYTFRVTPEDDFTGDMTVRIREGAANGSSGSSASAREDFAVDTEAPRLQSATVEDDELVLDYDEDLDEASEPAASAFDVTADGSIVSVSRVSIRNDKVTLRLANSVSRGDAVRLDYTVPSNRSIQDELGNEASRLRNERVTNNTDSNDEPPGPPRNLTATADGRTRIDLSWREPTDEGASRITGYRIRVSSNAGSTWSDLERDTDDTEYTHSGLDPGDTRHYRVFAINGEGPGPGSNIANATTEGGVPGAPRNLRATADGRTEIGLSWDAPSDAGSASITGYRIEVSSNAGNSWSALVGNTRSTRTTYTHDGLEAGTRRHYRVSAINAAGTGSPSTVANATTDGSVPPRAPTNLSATAVGESSIRLSWTAPSDDGGASIIGYRIEVSLTGTAGWSTLESNSRSTSTSYTHRGLLPGSKRYYRVAAINSEGTGTLSRVAHATTRAVLPGAPANLTATARGTTRIDLVWLAPRSDGGASVTGYRIESSTDGNAWTVLGATTNSSSTTFSHTNLSPGSTWHYRVSAVNVVGAGPASTTARATTDATVPRAPTGLSARAVGQSRIDLSWTRPSNDGGAAVSGYRIETSPNGGSTWTELQKNTNSTATAFSHTGLTAATTMHYRVSAINSVGTGNPSNVASATTEVNAPDAPTALTAAPDGTSQIRLSWTAPSDDGGASIIGYRIEVSLTGTAEWTVLAYNSQSASTSYTHRGLLPGSKRYYRVAAINSVGTGAYSGVAVGSTRAAVPGAPTALIATARSQTRIDLAWRAPGSDGGAPVTGYRIETSADGSTWIALDDNTNSTAATFSDTGLAPATTRHYRVFAINSAGNSPASNTARATTDATVPAAPTGLSARANGQTRIDLSWTKPSNDGGAAVTGYRIETSPNGGSTWTELQKNTNSTATAYTHSPLEAGTTWHYRVSAINSVGTGNPSNVASATTEVNAPDAPTALTAAPDGTSQIRLSWTAPADDGGARITGYRIEVSLTGTAEWTVLAYNSQSASTSYTHRGLLPGSKRYYRVAAINSVGTGAYSGVAVGSTRAAVPGAPTALIATARSQTRIDLAWRAPGSDGGAPVTGYRIETSADGSTWIALDDNTNSTAATFSDTGLAPATTRHYRVFAINSAGNSPASNTARATTDATVPAAPTGLSARANGQTRIDLSWTKPSNDGGAAVTGYRIETSPNGGSTWTELQKNTNSTATAFSHTGLTAATTMHYRVYAINKVGRGPVSNVASATTDATVPASPTDLTAVASGTSRIDLSWQVPGFDGGARITGYRIQAAENGNGPWSDLVTNTGSTSTRYSHTGLAPGTTRYYRVAAINSVGRGSESRVAAATTDATVPDPPTNLKATATESTTIELTWTAPSYDGGAPISGYRIEVRVDSTTWTDLVRSTGVAATAYSHTGLKPGSTRHYRVSAVNVAGTGQPSNIASATTDDPRERAGRVNKEVLSHAAASMTSSTVAAIASRVEAFADSDPFDTQVRLGGFSSLQGAGAAGTPATFGPGNGGLAAGVGTGHDFRQLLDGSSFLLPLGGEGAQLGIGDRALATWGRGEFQSMARPRGGLVEWDGDMLNLHAGADVRLLPHVLVGVAATRSTGDFAFTDRTGESPVKGTYTSRMTSLNPYVAGFLGTADVTGWITGGYGWGTVDIKDDREELRSSNVNTMTGAVGAAGVLLAGGRASLRLQGEGWLTRVEVQGSEQVDSVTLDMRRARVSLEWKQGYEVYAGHEVAAVLEVGARYDDGDAGNGAGLELGGGLQYVSPGGRLKVEGRGRMLATGHTGYEEWGASGTIQFDSHGRGRGLSVRLVPEWGEAGSGVQALWDQGVSDLPEGGFVPTRGRLHAEAEYGLPRFAGTPYARLYVVDGGARAFGSGVRYEITRVLDLRLEGTRVQSALAPAKHGLTVRGHWKF